jgi:hypothetical protein
MGAEPKKPRPPSGSSSGFHGVSASGRRWTAQIIYGGKQHHLGTFDTKQEAALAYDRAAREHGEGKKKLNYDSIEAAEEAATQAEAEHTLVHGMVAERQPSGFHGVSASGKRWTAQIIYGGKKHHLGTFDTKQEAALAYDRAAREHGGGKSKLNYDSIEAAEEAAAEAEAEHTLGMVWLQSRRSLVSHQASTGWLQTGSGGKQGSGTAASSTTSAPLPPSKRPHSHTTGQQGSMVRARSH